MTAFRAKTGDVFLADLEPVKGSEQGKQRPVIEEVWGIEACNLECLGRRGFDGDGDGDLNLGGVPRLPCFNRGGYDCTHKCKRDFFIGDLFMAANIDPGLLKGLKGDVAEKQKLALLKNR